MAPFEGVWYDCRVSDETKIRGWWSFLRAVLFKPTWELATTGVVFTVLTVTTWWRDNFATEEWKRRLELKGFLPEWSPAWWACIGLVALIIVVIRASHRLWIIEHRKADGVLGDFPRIVISYNDVEIAETREASTEVVKKAFTNNATVRNVSNDKTVFNVEVLDLHLSR